MEKLIELLNEYEGEDEGSETKWTKAHLLEGGLLSLQVISKKFGFIKWLVENEKIDFRELSYKNIYMSDYGSSEDILLAYNEGEQGIIYIVDYYESLLMLLSIQDEPINFLISILR